MINIHLLGPSGVGKSYWYTKFIQKYPQYESKHLVLKRIKEGFEKNEFSAKLRIMLFLYDLKLPKVSNYLKHKLFFHFYKGFQRKSKTTFLSPTDESVIKEYIKSVSELKQPQITILKNIDSFHDKWIEYKFYNYYLKENDLFLVEDGLAHITPIFIKEFADSKFIILKKDLAHLKKQRLQRAQTKPTTFIEYLLSSQELETYMDYIVGVYASKTKQYTQNCPENCIEINVDEEDVIQKMLSFIKSFE